MLSILSKATQLVSGKAKLAIVYSSSFYYQFKDCKLDAFRGFLLLLNLTVLLSLMAFKNVKDSCMRSNFLKDKRIH